MDKDEIRRDASPPFDRGRRHAGTARPRSKRHGRNAAKHKEPRSALPRRLSANLERITASAPTNHKLELVGARTYWMT